MTLCAVCRNEKKCKEIHLQIRLRHCKYYNKDFTVTRIRTVIKINGSG